METLADRAAACARDVAATHGEVVLLTRFPTGLCHAVFDVLLAGGTRIVVRVGTPETRHLVAGAVAWSQVLRPAGVPLPELLGHDVAAPLPYVVLERLAGKDLGLVFDELGVEERRTVARSVAQVQLLVGRTAPGDGYGYSADPTGRPPSSSWAGVLRENLQRSGARLLGASAEVRRLHARVLRRVEDLRDELGAVPPTPFLDDTTTKNVLVDGGRCTGIVDVDVVCFGDPLLAPALTEVSLVAADRPTDYVHTWLAAVGASRGPLLDLYRAVFCLDLLSEAGLAFNRDEPVVVDAARVERLTGLAESVLL